MVTKAKTCDVSYDDDFFQWSQFQAEILKKAKLEQLDLQNLAEETESLGKSEMRSLRSYLKVLLLHLLKIKYQPKTYKILGSLC